MSLSDPRLGWSLVLAPRAVAPSEVPTLPSIVARLAPDVRLPRVDPVTHVLHGPFPRAVLERAEGPGGLGVVVSGTGRALCLTVVHRSEGECGEFFPLAPLRGRIACALLGLDVPPMDAAPTGLEATPERLGTLLAERFEADDDWELIGLVEVAAALFEGLPADLPEGDGWLDHGDLRVARAVGVGAGHVALTLTGHHTDKLEREVMGRRLLVLTEGHLERPPAPAEYGAHALVWGRAARRGQRLVMALEGVVEEVRLATSWAVAGGPLPTDQEPDFDRLAARLEILAVQLREVVGALDRTADDLRPAAERVLGPGVEIPSTSPFTEASVRARRLREELAGRETEALRWARVLAVSRQVLPR